MSRPLWLFPRPPTFLLPSQFLRRALHRVEEALGQTLEAGEVTGATLDLREEASVTGHTPDILLLFTRSQNLITFLLLAGAEDK